MLNNLRFLFRDFLSFFRQDFNFKVYSYFFLVIAGSILVNYCTAWGQSFERGYTPLGTSFLNHLLRYGSLYYLIAIPILIIKKQYAELRNPVFYLKSALFITLLAFTDNFSWRDVLNFSNYNAFEQSYIFKVLWRTRNLFFILPVLIFLRIFIDKKIKGLYGLCRGTHHIKAYMSLYLVIVPVLIAVSFTPDFLSYYPSYKPWVFGGVFERPVWLNTFIYEFVYMSDFVMVELFFRGALVIGMAALLGRNAVLPMVAVYVALHFGKPAAETISAIFGGYFLGALAFQTRHIWGGVIIHMGIALLIELVRFFDYYILKIG